MKRTGLLGLALGLMAVGAAPVERARAEEVRLLPTTGTLQINAVYIGCANPGSSQDVGKTPTLKNTTTTTIPKGYVLKWNSSDGDSGSVTLDANLAPGATIKGVGKAGNVYSCTSNFTSKPDLVVKKVAFASGSVSVDIANLDAWVGSASSYAQVQLMSCNAGTVLSSVTKSVGTLAKNSTTTVAFATTLPGVRYYFRVKADSNGQITEKNENNNLWDTYNSCLY